MMIETINGCDVDIRKELYNNIIICGGNSLLGGLVDKISKKVTEGTKC